MSIRVPGGCCHARLFGALSVALLCVAIMTLASCNSKPTSSSDNGENSSEVQDGGASGHDGFKAALTQDIPSDVESAELVDRMEELDELSLAIELLIKDKKSEGAFPKLSRAALLLRSAREAMDKPGYAELNDQCVKDLEGVAEKFGAEDFAGAQEAFNVMWNRCEQCHEKYRDD